MDEITTWDDLAQLLRSLRGQRSLRAVARDVPMGHSTLDRYERNASKPSVEATEALDRYYGTGDRLTQLRNRLVLGNPSWPPVQPRSRFTTTFPAGYVGGVWVSVDRNGDQPFPTVRIRWGPWSVMIENLDAQAVGRDRAVLCFTKGDDGLSIPVMVDTSTPVVVQFGVGDVDPQEGLGIIDANSGWVRRLD